MNSDGTEQTDLTSYTDDDLKDVDADGFLGWFRGRLVPDDDGYDLEEILTYGTLEAAKAERLAADLADVELSRRKLLWKLAEIGAGVLVGQLLAKPLHDLTTPDPELFEDDWPTSLYDFATEEHRGVRLLTEELQQAAMPWREFKTESEEFLTEASNEPVQISAFFFRAYDETFFRRLTESHEHASAVNIHIADPRIPDGEHVSPLVAHQSREVLVHRHLMSNRLWRNMYEESRQETEYTPVPHINHVDLNRIRALGHAQRALYTCLYLDQQLEKASIYPIDDLTEQPFRGRIVGDRKAAFLRLPKGVIGTADPSRGYITDNEALVRRLDNELRRIRSNSPIEPAAMRELYADIYERNLELIDRAESDLVSPSNAESLREEWAAFSPPTSWSSQLDVSFSTWKRREEELFETTKAMKSILEREEPEPFGESPSVLATSSLKPDEIYRAVLQHQGLR